MKSNLSLLRSAILVIALVASVTADAQTPGDLQPGAKAPAFSLQDQNGKQQDLASLAGPKGLLLLFFRSADWCPFCKGQLVDLEAAQKAFASKGINIAAVSYDSPAILADFTKRRSITYPMLSDTGSALIDKFGIRNTAATGMQAGIPYPGYFLIDRQGVIQKRFFEDAYTNRITANNLYANLFGSAALPTPSRQLASTPHVTVTTTQSDQEVTPGQVVRLIVNVTPGRDTHVYAPGAEKQQYHVMALTLSPSDLYRTTPASYPKSVMLNFPELKETVPVYTGPTTITTTVAAVVNQTNTPRFAQNPNLTVKGELEYQACTSTVCFPPVKAPVEWTIGLRQFDRDRAPEDIRHK